MGLLVFQACSPAFAEHRPTEARRIAEAVTVAGFTRTAVADQHNYDEVTFASAWFIGPAPRPDPFTAVVIPGMELYPLTPPIVNQWETIVARGRGPGACAASIWFATGFPSPDERSSTQLTDEQLALVRSGDLVLIVVHLFNCGM
ncbi:hypothetical protein ACWIGI_17435 [Nocardia sp. NPDC055321]